MPDAGTWAHGPMASAASHPYFSMHGSSRHASMPRRSSGGGATHLAGSPGYDDDCFYDACSALGSVPSSLNSSVMMTPPCGASLGQHLGHAHEPRSPLHPPHPLPLPHPSPATAPTYKLTLNTKEVVVGVNYGAQVLAAAGQLPTATPCAPASSAQACKVPMLCSQPGVMLRCSEVKAGYSTSTQGQDMSLHLYSVAAHELLPYSDAASDMLAREFAAVPTAYLPHSLHCFRPGHTSFPAPEATTPSSSRSSSHTTTTAIGGAKGDGAPLFRSQSHLSLWPLLCFASGRSQEGVRASVKVKVHVPASTTEGTAGNPGIHGGSGGGGYNRRSGGGGPSTAPTCPGSALGGGVVGGGAGRRAGPGAARVAVEMMGCAVWVSTQAVARLSAAAMQLSSSGTTAGELNSGNRGKAGQPGGVHGGGRQQARSAAAASAAADLSAALPGAATPARSLPEVDLTLSVPHISVITLLQPGSSKGCGGLGAGPRGPSHPHMYAALDILAATPQHHAQHHAQHHQAHPHHRSLPLAR